MIQTIERAPDTLSTRMHNRRGRASIRAATRAAALVAAIALLLASCTSTPSPSASAVTVTPSPVASAAPSLAPSAAPTSVPPSPSAEPAESQVAGPAQCEAADLKASHGFVEGGAGSVFTTVVLVASVSCSIDLWPAFGLKDGSGNVLVNAVSGGPGRIDLDPELSYQSNVRMANWCGNDPAYPLAFELLTGGAAVKVTGGSFPEEDDLPQCSGENAGKTFDAQPWEVVP